MRQHILIIGNHSLFRVENRLGQLQLKKEVAHLPLPSALLSYQEQHDKHDDCSAIGVVKEYLTHLACGENFIVTSTNHNRLFGIGKSDFFEFMSEQAAHLHATEWIEVDLGEELSEVLCSSPENRITRLVCGGECVYVVVKDKWVFSRGSNSDGQLGIGDILGSRCDVFTLVSEFMNKSNGCDEERSRITHMKAGHYHTCLVVDHKIFFSTGYNSCGQLGIDTIWGSKTKFTHVTSLNLNDGELIQDIGLGGAHTAVLTTRGRLFTVGWNSYGELADGSNLSRASWHLVNVPFFISKLFVDAKANRTLIMPRDDALIYGAGSIMKNSYLNMTSLKIPNVVAHNSQVEVRGHRRSMYAIYDRSFVHGLSPPRKYLDLRPIHMSVTHLETGNTFMAAIISSEVRSAYPLLIHRMKDHKFSDGSFLFT